jgi:hypothetical protein
MQYQDLNTWLRAAHPHGAAIVREENIVKAIAPNRVAADALIEDRDRAGTDVEIWLGGRVYFSSLDLQVDSAGSD